MRKTRRTATRRAQNGIDTNKPNRIRSVTTIVVRRLNRSATGAGDRADQQRGQQPDEQHAADRVQPCRSRSRRAARRATSSPGSPASRRGSTATARSTAGGTARSRGRCGPRAPAAVPRRPRRGRARARRCAADAVRVTQAASIDLPMYDQRVGHARCATRQPCQVDQDLPAGPPSWPVDSPTRLVAPPSGPATVVFAAVFLVACSSLPWRRFLAGALAGARSSWAPARGPGARRAARPPGRRSAPRCCRPCAARRWSRRRSRTARTGPRAPPSACRSTGRRRPRAAAAAAARPTARLRLRQQRQRLVEGDREQRGLALQRPATRCPRLTYGPYRPFCAVTSSPSRGRCRAPAAARAAARASSSVTSATAMSLNSDAVLTSPPSSGCVVTYGPYRPLRTRIGSPVSGCWPSSALVAGLGEQLDRPLDGQLVGRHVVRDARAGPRPSGRTGRSDRPGRRPARRPRSHRSAAS